MIYIAVIHGVRYGCVMSECEGNRGGGGDGGWGRSVGGGGGVVKLPFEHLGWEITETPEIFASIVFLRALESQGTLFFLITFSKKSIKKSILVE